MKIERHLIFYVSLLCLLLTIGQSLAGQPDRNQVSKEDAIHALKTTLVNPDRKAGIHDGNQIRTRFTNFGSIGRYPPRIEWPAYSNHEYGNELGPIIAAEFVLWDSVVAKWDTIHCSIEGILDGGDDDLEPYPGYCAPPPNESPAMSGDSNTWPPEWTEWPGLYGTGVMVADQESYFVMSDQASNGAGNNNPIYDYYPEDDSLQGLAIEISSRGLQWAGNEERDFIIFVYEIKNIGYKALDKVVAGYFVDLDVGGYPDFADDRVSFNEENNFVYSWDTDNYSPNFTGDVGWVGFKYLESPYNDHDGIDNDDDGMIDESQYNLIDDDGDWDVTDEEAQQDPNDLDQLSDDVGADGIAETGDEGEGDGMPTVGEPDFEIRDIDESDQLGLTSMMSYDYTSSYYAGNDSTGWIALTPGSFSEGFPGIDAIFFFGSGYFSLEPEESQPMSIAMVLGADSTDLWQNAQRAQAIYQQLPGQPNTCYCYGGQDSSGNTWSLFDFGGNILEDGDWTYVAWTGPDGAIDPPVRTKRVGGVSGDDVLLAEGEIQAGRFLFSVAAYNPGWGHPAEGEKIYCRIFDGHKGDLTTANYYANSQTYAVKHKLGEEFYCLFPGGPGGGYTDTPLGGVSVELMTFEAMGRDSEVLLEWKTASETDNFGFHIERSLDEVSFERVTQEVIPGAGNSATENTYAYVDIGVVNGTTYYYNLISVEMDGLEEVANESPVSATPAANVPEDFFLRQNYPNPFNPVTEIMFAIPEDVHVILKVYNVLGAEVETLLDAHQQAGFYTVRWDAVDVTSGVYFCTLSAGDFKAIKKMVLLK